MPLIRRWSRCPYHSYGGLVLYPWGFRAGELAPDLTRYVALAGTELAPAVTDNVPGSPSDHYHPGPGWNLYPTNGEYTDWAYRTYGTIAFTTELTSGCCVQDLYYGFEFPDDSVLVERVFRDNLPFARSLIDASGNLSRAAGASGLVPGAPRFTSLWPDSWLNLDALIRAHCRSRCGRPRACSRIVVRKPIRCGAASCAPTGAPTFIWTPCAHCGRKGRVSRRSCCHSRARSRSTRAGTAGFEIRCARQGSTRGTRPAGSIR
jgi:hypothetical protein